MGECVFNRGPRDGRDVSLRNFMRERSSAQ